MADKKKSQLIFFSGVNLAPLTEGEDERRFEAGQDVPVDLTDDEFFALNEMEAIGDPVKDAERVSEAVLQTLDKPILLKVADKLGAGATSDNNKDEIVTKILSLNDSKE